MRVDGESPMQTWGVEFPLSPPGNSRPSPIVFLRTISNNDDFHLSLLGVGPSGGTHGLPPKTSARWEQSIQAEIGRPLDLTCPAVAYSPLQFRQVFGIILNLKRKR